MSCNSLMNLAFEDKLVRIHVDDNGEPWFCAKDVCRILELENPSDTIKSLDEDEKITLCNSEGNPKAGIPHSLAYVSESGLYALIFRSRKPEAKRLRKWVTAEVLPALRRTGSYTLPGAERALPEAEADALDALPESVLRMHPKIRERFLVAAQRTATLCGMADKNAIHGLFVEYCLKLGCGGSPALAPVSFNPKTNARALLRAFVEEHCEQCGTRLERLSVSSVYDAYCDWCRDQPGGVQPITRHAFIDYLPRVAPCCEVTRPRIKGERKWYVLGLRVCASSPYACD